MSKIYYDYLDIKMGRRGNYTPSEMIYVPALYGKAMVYDEANTSIKTPNSVYNFGYIEILDETVLTTVQDLVTRRGQALWMSPMTTEEAKAMLVANGYVEDPVLGFEISPAITEMGIDQEAQYLIID